CSPPGARKSRKTDYREALWAAGRPFPTSAGSRDTKVAKRCGLKIVLIAAHLWPVARQSPRRPAETIVDSTVAPSQGRAVQRGREHSAKRAITSARNRGEECARRICA